MKIFWNSYIEMAGLLLLFTRATMEGNWELHVLKNVTMFFLHMNVKTIPDTCQSICFICKICQIHILMPMYIFHLVVFVFREALMDFLDLQLTKQSSKR